MPAACAAATLAAAALATALASACGDGRERAAPTPATPAAAAEPSATAKPEQSFAEAMQIACAAPERAELPPESAGDVNRAMVLAAWIDRHVRNREVRQLMGGSAAQTPQGKIEALEAGARRAGIARCALVELWLGSKAAETSTSTPADPAPSSADP